MASSTITIVDIIPVADSGETRQNSEPSLAIDPNDPTQIIAGSFSAPTPFFLTTDGGATLGRSALTAQTPFFVTTDGGATWSAYDILVTNDKSLAWKADGSGFLAATLTTGFDIRTYSGTTS